MIVLEGVVTAGIVHMGSHLVLPIAGDLVLIMVELAAQSTIGTTAQCMIGAGVLIMGGTEVLGRCMGGTGVPSTEDTAGSLLALVSCTRACMCV